MKSKKGLRKQQSGFTLIEMMISATILMVAILGANIQYVQQMKSEGQMNLNIKVRGILNQAISKVLASPNDFPPLVSNTGTPMTYVACFTESGTVVANKYGSASYNGVYIADPTKQTDYCPVSAGAEVHITRTSADTAVIDLIVLSTPGRQFTALRTNFRTTVNFEKTL